MSRPMVRKQIYLTAELDRELRREARRQRKSEAALLREALAARLGTRTEEGIDPSADSLWELVGIGSESTDLSERVDEVLYGRSKKRR